MPHKNVVTWNTMIRGYLLNGFLSKALVLFHQMPERDIFTYNTVMSGLMHGLLAICEMPGKDLKSILKELSYRDVASWTVMISGLAKAGRMAEACKFVEGMPVKDVRAWNVMLEGYVGFECVEKAGILFQEMPEKDLDSWIA
ncbi:hypothetical protein SCA6_015983 [Theobroma cacao]